MEVLALDIKKEALGYLEKIGISKGTTLYEAFETGFEMVPYLGKAYQMWKMNRFEKRLKESEHKLKELSAQLTSTDDATYEFMKERVIPIAIEQLIEEHQDQKIDYILNGLSSTIDNVSWDEDFVLEFYDTLRNLKYADLRRLMYYADHDKYYPETIFYKGSSLDGLSNRIDAKLIGMHLIQVKRTLNMLEGFETEINNKDVSLTKYGEDFANFILAIKDE